ncbi:cytochrome P450 [Actinomadura scrupuli]|uniref:cytochrome P450 n=1 Tax=Actinomadura scrupuli TaxID=559629 RepID=UPI003D95C504
MIPADFPDAWFADGHPDRLYGEIRSRGGVVRHPALPRQAAGRGAGSTALWVVGTHAEVRAIAMDPVAYRSGDGILIPEMDFAYDSPPTMMHTDPPGHTRYRGLVAPAFRPSLLRGLEPAVRDRVRTLLAPFEAGFEGDVVAALAVPLPLQVICLMLGIPEEDWPRFFRWSEAIMPGAGDLTEQERDALRMEAGGYLVGEAHRRRGEPRDDVISLLARSGMDQGEDRLTDAELVMFLIQLLVAGNETTRHSISGGLLALAGRPDQWAALRSHPGLIPQAVEEILRWTSPVVYFLRTATRPARLGEAEVAAGDRLMLLYGSANRDTSAFGPSADRFEVARRGDALNLAFGFGPHFCLGAALARMEIRIVLEELLARYSVLEPPGPIAYNGSCVVTGLSRAHLAAH